MYNFFITAYVMVAKGGTEKQLGEGKGEIHPRTGNEGPDGEYTFFNLGARWGGWSTPRPGSFTPGRTRFPFIGGSVSPRAGMEGCGKTRAHRDSIPTPSNRSLDSLYRSIKKTKSLHIQVHVDVRVTRSFSSATLAWTVQLKLRLDSCKKNVA